MPDHRDSLADLLAVLVPFPSVDQYRIWTHRSLEGSGNVVEISFFISWGPIEGYLNSSHARFFFQTGESCLYVERLFNPLPGQVMNFLAPPHNNVSLAQTCPGETCGPSIR